MGMGEPLLNYANVIDAIDKITSPEGLGMAPRRITLSTVGIPKMIRKMAEDEVKFNLAISLHSAINETRSRLMPINEVNPLEDLADALTFWYSRTKRKVTYEYAEYGNNLVIGQRVGGRTIEAGQKVLKGTTVDLTVVDTELTPTSDSTAIDSENQNPEE